MTSIPGASTTLSLPYSLERIKSNSQVTDKNILKIFTCTAIFLNLVLEKDPRLG
jgi:hypothetical protein